MKRKTFRITDDKMAYAASGAILDLKTDGKVEVVLQNYKFDRSIPQNSLYYKWLTQRGQQLHTTMEEQRNYCKLHYGIPILRRDNDEFKAIYDRYLIILSYEAKLATMPIIDVSSIFKVDQMAEYLTEIERESLAQGLQLSHPDDLYQEAMGRFKSVSRGT